MPSHVMLLCSLFPLVGFQDKAMNDPSSLTLFSLSLSFANIGQLFLSSCLEYYTGWPHLFPSHSALMMLSVLSGPTGAMNPNSSLVDSD
ncbi:hypothetical protein QBC40DRAFT_11703 [Triangularia verruculosa]|uniref:Uncharacterized protein n=1 Tax=Triangularia verruculosa TaxID=2587418 RepID=A0AAN6X8M4_9PEZI|nr:hypothetical protein QBC40DRAFT_11703 [Triangularia verruculosa]